MESPVGDTTRTFPPGPGSLFGFAMACLMLLLYCALKEMGERVRRLEPLGSSRHPCLHDFLPGDG